MLRASLDHHNPAIHEAERGLRSWQPALDGLRWLSQSGFSIAVAVSPAESDNAARVGYAALFAAEGIAIDAHDPARLVLFPEIDATADVPTRPPTCRKSRPHAGASSANRPPTSCARPAGWWSTAAAKIARASSPAR